MGVHKTVNGAYRYRYAPFLMPTYYVKGCSPLALPLGELSPQVTERVLQPFSNDKINLCTHITEIPVDIPVGESQNLQPKRHQELRTFSIISKPLRFVMLRAIQFNDQSGRSAVKVHYGSADHSLFVHLCWISAEKKIPELALVGRHLSCEAVGAVSNWVLSFGVVMVSPLRSLAALDHLSQRERQGMLARYTERCIEVRPLSVRQIGVYCSIR